MDVLSYDDTPYETQLPTLANRIGTTKVYLLDEATGVKRKRNDETEVDDEDEIAVDMDSQVTSHRPNAILITGLAIADLTTELLFQYVSHYSARPLALEWIDDTTCVFVFPTNSSAREAFDKLQNHDRTAGDGFVAANEIIGIPGVRADVSEDEAELKMRWATTGDVKRRGAKQASEFYRKHGIDAGRLPSRTSSYSDEEEDGGRHKRRRRTNNIDEEERARLDADLDRFLAADGDEVSPEADGENANDDGESFLHSTMRSDHISDTRSLLARTSAPATWLKKAMDDEPDDGASTLSSLAARLTERAPSPGPFNRGMRSDNPDELDGGGLPIIDNGGLPILRFGATTTPDIEAEGNFSGKMRSDIASEVTVPRRRGRGGKWEHEEEELPPITKSRPRQKKGRGRGETTSARSTNTRVKKTQEELDSELDAFLGRS